MGARLVLRRGQARLHSVGAGYTLVELLVTLALVAILSAIGAPIFYPALVEFRLSSASEEILAAVDFARTRALITGTTTRVTFDIAAETVLVEELRASVDIGNGVGADLAAGAIETTSFQPSAVTPRAAKAGQQEETRRLASEEYSSPKPRDSRGQSDQPTRSNHGYLLPRRLHRQRIDSSPHGGSKLT